MSSHKSTSDLQLNFRGLTYQWQSVFYHQRKSEFLQETPALLPTLVSSWFQVWDFNLPSSNYLLSLVSFDFLIFSFYYSSARGLMIQYLHFCIYTDKHLMLFLDRFHFRKYHQATAPIPLKRNCNFYLS